MHPTATTEDAGNPLCRGLITRDCRGAGVRGPSKLPWHGPDHTLAEGAGEPRNAVGSAGLAATRQVNELLAVARDLQSLQA